MNINFILHEHRTRFTFTAMVTNQAPLPTRIAFISMLGLSLLTIWAAAVFEIALAHRITIGVCSIISLWIWIIWAKRLSANNVKKSRPFVGS